MRGGTPFQMEGYPIPVPCGVGTPSSPGGGYPIPGPGWGYPIQSWLVGTLGYPLSRPEIGYPPIQTWHGMLFISWMGYPQPRPGIRYLPPRPGMGYLHIQIWDGVTPLHLDLGWGNSPPPPSRPGMGYPPTLHRDVN